MTVGNRLLAGFVGDLLAAVASETFVLQMLDDSIAFDPGLGFLDEVSSAAVGSPVTLPGVTLSVGDSFVDLVADDDPALEVDLTGLEAVAMVIVIDTGTPSTSRIVGWYDRRADSTPILVDDDTGAITFPYGYFVRAAV